MPERNYDLEERLIEFACAIIDIVEALPNTKVGNHIATQMLSSGTSPAPNYGEATAAESRKDFIHKMKICLKEFRETNVWLKVIRKRKLVKSLDVVEAALDKCKQLIQIFVASIKTAQKNLLKQ
jgi:four helix bundle protein